MNIKVCVLTVSDRCSRGQAEDGSGRTLKDLISATSHLSLCRYAIVPDDGDRIKVCFFALPLFSSSRTDLLRYVTAAYSA